MDNTIRFESRFSTASAKVAPVRPRGLARELAEQVEILADGPSHSLTYSDLYDRVRSGVLSVRRLLPIRTAHPAR
jgi:hypothetical protein